MTTTTDQPRQHPAESYDLLVVRRIAYVLHPETGRRSARVWYIWARMEGQELVYGPRVPDPVVCGNIDALVQGAPQGSERQAVRRALRRWDLGAELLPIEIYKQRGNGVLGTLTPPEE